MAFEVICSRCNKLCSESKQCERFDCELPEYYEAYAKEFKVAPLKYYCSLTGVVNSGKTLFLIALVNSFSLPTKDIKAFYVKNKIHKIEIIDPVSSRLLNSLIKQCEVGGLEFTADNKPLGFFNIIVRLTTGETYEIVLFNSSGEKIEDQYKQQKTRTDAHELKGSSVIYFVDPREDSSLNNILKAPKANNQSKNMEIAEFTYGVLQHINSGVLIVNQPLAVCISKFDLLLPLVPLDVPEDPFVEVSHTDFFKKINLMSKSLSTFLHKNSSTVDATSIQKQFGKHKYFAVAPFGSDAMPAFWKDRAPKGIHAPFFWILKELNII